MTPTPRDGRFRVFVDDQEVGSVEAGPITPAQVELGLTLALRYRANWVGLWKLMALLAEGE